MKGAQVKTNEQKQQAQVKAKNIFSRLWQGVRRIIRGYNHRMKKVYSPAAAALTGTAIVLVMAVVTLFITPFVGVADDGSLNDILLSTGLGYRADDLKTPTGAYATRVFLHSTEKTGGMSAHLMMIRAAMWLDDQFTHDLLFDVRFLALLYVILYLPAVFLVLRGIVARVKAASEATFLVILGAAILGDAGMTAYFNSLYPEAMWQILLMYCMGFCLALQHGKETWTYVGLLGLAAAGSAVSLVEAHCAAVGLVLTFFCIRQIMMEDKTRQTSVMAGVAAIVIFICAVLSAVGGVSRFTETSKMHAMTNGVLLRSQDPAKTLEEFDIDPRFETLTDTSAYADYPYTLSGNPEIQRDFLSRYTTIDIIIHYVRDPLAYIGLLELGTRAAFQTARAYVGNYESATGLPERARNPLLTFYSNFKGNTLPQTLGFLVILFAVYWGLFRRRRGLQHFVTHWTLRERQIMLDTFLCLLFIGIADISAIVFMSGTAELERYQTLYGVCVDGLLLMFISEILHRLNILGSEE